MKQLLLSWLASLLILTSFGQRYSFINYSIKEGLSQTQANAFCQDHYGYIWIGTLGGVSRFDGLDFETFTTRDGLIDNNVYAVYRDKKGSLWFGSRGGVSRYDGGVFTNYYFKQELQDYYVIAIAEDADGKLWFGTDWGGAALFDGKDFTYFDNNDGLADQTVRSLLVDQKGATWLGIVGGLTRYYDGKFETQYIPELEGQNIGALMEDRSGRIWIGTARDGIVVLNGDQQLSYTTENGLINNNIEDLFEDKDGNIWVCTRNGVSKFDGVEFTNFGEEEGLPFSRIKSVMQDNEGNIWFASDGAGIFRFSGEAFVSYTRQDGMHSDLILSVLQDKDSNHWFSTYEAGVIRYDGKNYQNYDETDGLGSIRVWCSLMDDSARLWFGTSNGLSYFADGSFTNLKQEDGLADSKVTALHQSADGLLWVGHRQGVSTWQNGQFNNYSGLEGFEGIKIRSITSDSRGKVWFGAQNGLYVRNPNGDFSVIDHIEDLVDATVHSLAIDARDNLWIGTTDGLIFYNPDEKESTTYRWTQSVASLQVQFLVFDLKQQLWIGSNNGLFRLDVPAVYEGEEPTFVLYNDLDGINSLETNLNSAYRDAQGTIWMGTSLGTVRYNPEKEKVINQRIDPLLSVTGVRLFLTPTDWSKYTDSISEQGLPLGLELPHNKNYLTFDYRAISHSNPAKVRYRFKLLNFDEDWSPVTRATFATYSNLPDGEYEFLVEAMNKDGKWTQNSASFAFTILTPYWKEGWFMLLCFLGLMTITALIYRQRMKARWREREREDLINKSKMLALEAQTLNASMNRHFIFNALNSIQYYINTSDRLSANRYLTRFAKLVRKNLDSSQTNVVPLSDELERLELYLTLEHMRFQNKFVYDIKVDDTVDIEAVKIPAMLLQPYVENSIWHGILPMEESGKTDEGKIKVHIRHEKDTLRFIIEDNGIGFDESLKTKGIEGKSHVSKGMAITTGRIELMQKMTKEDFRITGPYELKSETGETLGTRVEITLPYNNTHWQF